MSPSPTNKPNTQKEYADFAAHAGLCSTQPQKYQPAPRTLPRSRHQPAINL
jgi:hypothetical protein